jgi:hypothetical protein
MQLPGKHQQALACYCIKQAALSLLFRTYNCVHYWQPFVAEHVLLIALREFIPDAG